jgi:putative flippase GtrA
MTMALLRQFGPYGVIAAICAGLNLAALIAGDAIGLHYAVSTTVSFVACVIVGYSLHCRFTFATVPSLAGLARYTAAMALNYPLAIGAIWLFHDLLACPMILAAPASTLVLTVYNFLSSRWAMTRRAHWNTEGATRP